MDDDRRWLRPYLGAIVACEILLLLAYGFFPEAALFDLDKEYNVPAWFACLQLAAVGAACLFAFEGERRDPRGAWPWSGVWVALAAGFVYLSADEMLALHERALTDILRHALPADSLLQAVLPWQIVFAPGIVVAFVVVGAMLYTRFGAAPALRRIGLAALGFWTLSFVCEGAAKPLFIPARLYRLEVGLEETAELLGGTCLLYAFAAYAVARHRGVPLPVRTVRWRSVLGVAGGLCAAAAVAIAALTLSNPGYLHRRAGDKFVDKREYARAIPAYERAVASRPDDADLWRRLGSAALRARRFDVAARAYREAATRAPGDPKLQVNLGVALHQHGDLAGAIAAYEAAVHLDPAYARAHRNLGVTLEKQGDFRAAEAQYRLAVRHDPRMADAYRYLGDLLERQDRLDEARDAWRQSLEAAPDQRNASALRRRLGEGEAASRRDPARQGP
jgi:tetratricopeptide (TPR) repeat protein